ncbi:MAG: Ig-like domain-containing protein [Verrucomicrobiota bacterium]
MNTMRLLGRRGRFFALSFAFLMCGGNLFAQTTGTSSVPVVTIQATQPIAKPGSPGVFTVFRAGDTNLTLNVFYTISGSASNGVDYALISNWVAIPGGATSNTVTITPETNASVAVVKTVILQLAPPITLNPINYIIGVPSNAVVYAEDNGATNLPPTVSIVQPPDGSVFYTPTNIILLAKASDPDGTVTNVEFFAGTNDLGQGSPVVLDPPGVNGTVGLVYFFDWMNPSPGNYPLTAVATDNGGTSTTSAPVNISVLPGPPTNLPPVVRIISPANGAVFFAPVNLPLYAFAADPDGSISSVEFFAGTNSLGFGQNVPIYPPPGPGPQPSAILISPNLFSLIWSNAPVGSNVLTAVATANNDLSTTSAPVDITVLPAVPPPTNRPPVVSIVATDPIAIATTNCWVWPGETNTPPTWAAWPAAVSCLFTNCGPKTATFTVRRAGDTNDDVLVTYDIGGTASNGVDYAALPGFVTVSAGEHNAFITIVPVDEGPSNSIKSVILTLTASTNTPPDYLIGWPPKAAAIIIEGIGPRPVASLLPGGCFHLAAPGPDAAWFCIQYSTDLVNWTAVCTNQVINGSIDYVDPDAQGSPARYYRAVPVAGPPSD